MNEPYSLFLVAKMVGVMFGLIALAIIAMMVYEKLFGQFGKLVSELELIQTQVVDQCPVYILAWRLGGPCSEDELDRAFRAARITNAEEDIMLIMQFEKNLPPLWSITSRVGKKKFVAIHTNKQTPHDRSVTAQRTVDKYTLFACIPAECAKSSRSEFRESCESSAL